MLNLALQKKLEVSTVIKVDGIPKTGPKGFNHLQQVITKIFTQFGKILRDYYPKSENGDTKGWVPTLNISLWMWTYILKKPLFSFISFLFIEYEEHESALKAALRANNSQFCELTLLVQLVSDFKTWVELINCSFS